MTPKSKCLYIFKLFCLADWYFISSLCKLERMLWASFKEEPMVEEAAAEAPAEDAAMDEDIYDYDPSADVQEEEYDYDYDYDAEEEL